MARKIKPNRAGGRQWGLLTMLGVILVTLKLTDNLDWSWWIVLAPFYVPAIIVTIFFIGLVVFLVRKHRRDNAGY